MLLLWSTCRHIKNVDLVMNRCLLSFCLWEVLSFCSTAAREVLPQLHELSPLTRLQWASCKHLSRQHHRLVKSSPRRTLVQARSSSRHGPLMSAIGILNALPSPGCSLIPESCHSPPCPVGAYPRRELQMFSEQIKGPSATEPYERLFLAR